MLIMQAFRLQDQPLHRLFARAQELFAQAELGSEPAAAGTRDLLDQCAVAVDRLAIFSGCELVGTRTFKDRAYTRSFLCIAAGSNILLP